MLKKATTHSVHRSTATSVLTQKDAEEFHTAVSAFAKNATSSKKAARSALKTLGTHTATGRISRKYG